MSSSEAATSTTATDIKESKRLKTGSIFDNDNNKNILSNDLLDRSESIKESYRSAKPYPYAQVHDLFQEQFLTSVRDEIKSQTKVNFKESDLFRVYQSIDLANLVEGSKQATDELPHVMQLRNVLYSQEWRSLVESWAGLPPGTLTSQIDCACNCHAPGCHLLCHDDVIGTRKISYIIYLTENTPTPWDVVRDGGALELYGPQLDDGGDYSRSSDNENQDNEEKEKSSSMPIPVARAAPTFNSMAFFVVDPGRSFHAVQEVIGDRPRLSLQGWYHATAPPPNMEEATLQQLKKTTNNDPKTTTTDDEGGDNEEDNDKKLPPSLPSLDGSDIEYLKEYIKDEYLSESSMTEIQQKFEADSSVQLRDFLLPKWLPTTNNNNNSSSKNNKSKNMIEPHNSNEIVYDDSYYKTGMSSEWKLVGPAHKQRYLRYDGKSKSTVIKDDDDDDDDNVMADIGTLLQHVKTNVFESEQFKRYLDRITSLGQPIVVRDGGGGEIRRFRPGLDYTVAHYGLLVEESVLDATMCFVCDDNEDDKHAWESGDVGGFECYIEADDDYDNNNKSAAGGGAAGGGNDPAEEYNEDDDTELLSVSASNNTLSLVYRDPGTMRFVKYVGSSAPSSRYDICMEYDVPPGDDDDDDDDDGEDVGDVGDEAGEDTEQAAAAGEDDQ